MWFVEEVGELATALREGTREEQAGEFADVYARAVVAYPALRGAVGTVLSGNLETLCRAAIAEGKDHPGGYALMSGCEVPPQAPPVNVYQMVKACREFGRY